jgi:nitroimidazol reductase NimA-like FMN-containing flavoprotein (pyridoxamine 5'-phosphate oxidase superfamily)
MARTHRPEFFELPRAEAIELLKRQHIGRLAYAFHDRVGIEPISFVYSDGWVYGRTSPGTKLTTMLHHPWVAFEVDEIESHFDWRSVVVHGALYWLQPDGGDRDREAYLHAVQLLREFDAAVLTAADTTPERDVLFRVHADEITARGARSIS